MERAARTALIVDDDPAIVRLLTLVLRSEGMRICSAADGQEALDKLSDCRPNVIVLDLQMPRMDGLTFLRIIREQGCEIPVLVLSARDTASPDVPGADEYLAKPFLPDQLALRVRRLTA